MTEDYDIDLPQPNVALGHCNLLSESNLRSLTFEEVLNLTWACFPHLPAPRGKFADSMLLYRVRTNSTPMPFRRVSDLGAPPAERVSALGRANQKGQSVFYAGVTPDAALLETCPAHGTSPLWLEIYATLGVWKPKRELSLVVLWANHAAFATRPELLAVGEFFHDRMKDQVFHFALGPDDAYGSALIICSHIAYSFAVEDYKLSLAYAERLLSSGTRGHIDGILYPSVATSYQVDNVVVRADAIDSLELQEVSFVRYINKGGQREVDARVIARGRPTGGEIEWTWTS